MLSSVSYVCSGMFAGMWVISTGTYLGVLVRLSFRSCCSSVRVIFVCSWLFIICVCSLCFYFADVFSSTMSSDLRAAVVLHGSGVLQSLPSSLPDAALASRVPSTYAKCFSSYNSWRFWAREHGLTVFPASPFHVAIYLCHLGSLLPLQRGA